MPDSTPKYPYFSTGETVGQRVNFYRTNRGLSQMELETYINAAPGSISRIENDRVNPTKETLFKISSYMHLNAKEANDLVGIQPLFPSQTDIESAVAECANYLRNDRILAYLVDDWVRVHAVSSGLLSLLNITQQELSDKYLGKALLEICFDPALKIRSLIDQKYFAEVMALEILRTDSEGGLDPKLFSKLSTFPNFKEVYLKTKLMPKDSLFAGSNKFVYLKLNGESYKFNYGFERLKSNYRFEVVELLPIVL